MEHMNVILQRKPHLHKGRMTEQTYHGRTHAYHVEAEEETGVVSGNLQQGHLIHNATLEGGACLGIEAHHGLCQQEVDGLLSFQLRLYHNDATIEGHHFHLRHFGFFYFFFYSYHSYN